MASTLWVLSLGFFLEPAFIEIEYFGRLSYVFIFCFSIYFITKIPNENYHSVFLYLVILILLFKYDRFSGLQEILIFSYLSIASKILYDLENKKRIIRFDNFNFDYKFNYVD